ncbi:hypothetical protein WR25_10676 [Diploscapter pachys]|uniref:Uncharacterized protein n=1 Tax=Diploscapter pachys TaxID=2018661 RepID=A0A2A2LJ39_9BILA|nr:hypothetical protein WR25_10676 [Diploscapter pachys]
MSLQLEMTLPLARFHNHFPLNQDVLHKFDPLGSDLVHSGLGLFCSQSVSLCSDGISPNALLQPIQFGVSE